MRVDARSGYTVNYDWFANFDELKKKDSLFCLHGVGPSTNAELVHAGIRTLSDLARIKNVRKISRKSGLSEQNLKKLRLQAISVKQNKTFQILPFLFPDANPIFFDIETDTLCNRIWLIGALNRSKFSQFYADTWKDEKKILRDFLCFLENNPDSHLVSYSGTCFDQYVTQRALKRLRIDSKPFSSMPHLDLLNSLKRSFIFPTKSYGLKHLGNHLGYSFKHPDVDGLIVASTYERHIRQKTPLEKKFLEYNEDDVKALPFIAKKVTSRRAKIKRLV